MPLRDHFRPPVSKHSWWEGFHGGWPMTMVLQLSRVLPEEYTAEPRVHLGGNFERAPPKPSLTFAADLTEQYAYEVRVFDQERGRELVAAVEIVSPAKKDRPESRPAFIAKCAALLQERVCVAIVDLVTVRHFNLYMELLELIGRTDPDFQSSPPIYAVTMRGRKVDQNPYVETWAYPLVVGQTLPTLPIWLTKGLAVPLELESSYDEACRALRIR